MAVAIIVDGKRVHAIEGQVLLEAALAAGLYIPHLCHHPDLPPFDSVKPAEICYQGSQVFRQEREEDRSEGCGLCAVELQGKEDPVFSCNLPVEEGIEIVTTTPRLEALRREKLAAILEHHPHACLLCAQKEGCSLTQCSSNVPEEERCCPQFEACELRKVAEYVGIQQDLSRYMPRQLYREENRPLFLRDYNLCIGCLRCVRVCSDVIGARALAHVVSRDRVVVGMKDDTSEESGCRFCGACIEVCPTGALRDKKLQPGDRQDFLVPCIAHCPVRMDIPSYVHLAAQGKYAEAATVIRESVPLASSLGYICHHPCEESCRRGEINSSVSICGIKRAVLEKSRPLSLGPVETKTGKNIAVVGSGPAGLVASYFLARKGHSVTIFESLSEPGGMLRWAIPEYRLPAALLQEEIQAIQAAGVKILLNTPFPAHEVLNERLPDGWDGVFVASGAQESKKIDVDGAQLKGVFWGLDFLRETKKGDISALSGKVVVIGGGNAAFDAVLTALRLGASDVNLVCLEQRNEMPAFSWEVREAEEEGVRIHTGWGPLKISGERREVRCIEFQKCTSVFDSQGRFHPTFDPEQKMTLEVDSVILAVGQKADLSFLPEKWKILSASGDTIKVNPQTLETAVSGVFAGGDVTLGPASAVEAMALGEKAASSIDLFLGGQGLYKVPPIKDFDKKQRLWLGEAEGFFSRDRLPMAALPLFQRVRSFQVVQLGYREDEAREEAGRCLRCDLRLMLSPVRFPPEKWVEFTSENIRNVPEAGGAFQLIDEEKNVIFIAGTPNLRDALLKQLPSNVKVRYFCWEEDPMYTKRESELIQKHLQKHGCLPPGNAEIDDLF